MPENNVPQNSWQQERARIASLTRSREDQDPDLVTARRNMRYLLTVAKLTKALDADPSFTAEQRGQLTALCVGQQA